MDRSSLWKSLCTPEELHALGFTDSAIRHLHRKGELVKVRKGVYREPLELHYELAALDDIFGYAKLRRNAVFCLDSAALLHGLPLLEMPQLVHINTSGSHGMTGGVAVHRFQISDNEVSECAEGLSLTTPLRTLTDLVRSKPLIDGLVLADSLVFQGLLPINTIVSTLESAVGKGQSQAHQIARLVRRGAQSPGETLMRFGLWRLGYPEPVLQYRVATDDGDKYLDGAYRELKLALEFDGNIKYGGYGEHPDHVRWKERERDRALLNEGWSIVRCGWGHCVGNAEGLEQLMAKAWTARGMKIPQRRG